MDLRRQTIVMRPQPTGSRNTLFTLGMYVNLERVVPLARQTIITPISFGSSFSAPKRDISRDTLNVKADTGW